MEIESYLSTKEFKTRNELIIATGLSDRKVRNEINKLRKKKPVISNSKTKGYKLAKEIKDINTKEEAKEELGQILYTINENKSRIKDMTESNKICFEYKKRLEEEIMIMENEKHIPYVS